MEAPTVAKRRPPLRIDYEPRFCANTVVDLTVGCSFRCIYCPFSDLSARREGLLQPTTVDLSNLDEIEPPRDVFLSPGSDAFAPQAAPLTHALLERWLPAGTVVSVITKGVIPERTLDLMAEHRKQIEGVGVGVTSLDERRNRVVEPGCSPGAERLHNIDRLAARGLMAGLRMDPMFPTLDDTPAALTTLADEAARRGAVGITAAYVFAWGPYLRRLRREPLLAESAKLLTEPAPMTGGTAFSVSLERKIETFRRLADLARARSIGFSTCGCKDLRVRDSGLFIASCRNPYFRREPGGERLHS